jgi:hypothetical protein
MGEAAAFAQVLTLDAIAEQVRFARARFGLYDLIDFVAVLIGYLLSDKPTLLAFYQRLAPFAEPFLALFGRQRLPHRSTLSRFLAALDQPAVEALRTVFEHDLQARTPFASPGGVVDRRAHTWTIIDIDGTRCAARQRALPHTEALPAPHRRFDQVCAKGYQGRKRGEVVRTRTIVLQAHTHQQLATFGGPGNGDYRGELQRALEVITAYARQAGLPLPSILIRLDGLYGDAAPLTDVLSAGLGVIVRSRAYHLLDLEVVKQQLAAPPDQVSVHPESGTPRALYDCPSVPLSPAGRHVRLVIATHPAAGSPPTIGTQRDAMVYELFVSTLPSLAFTASDVLDLYLHRGSFETVLADEDKEQESDRWYSHTHWGQEFAQILAQWVWNLRLELGHTLAPSPLRTTEFAPAHPTEPTDEPPAETTPTQPSPAEVYGPPQWAGASFTHGFPGSAFTLQPDGTLRCPADHPLYPQERRPECNGSVRVLYAARIGDCRSCPLRAHCQESTTTRKPRRVSAVLHPLAASPAEASPALAPLVSLPSAPLLWLDWPRCALRRAWLARIRSEAVEVTLSAAAAPAAMRASAEIVLTRAQRAHWRFSWQERFARNQRSALAPLVTITLHGLPAIFASSFGFTLLATA